MEKKQIYSQLVSQAFVKAGHKHQLYIVRVFMTHDSMVRIKQPRLLFKF